MQRMENFPLYAGRSHCASRTPATAEDNWIDTVRADAGLPPRAFPCKTSSRCFPRSVCIARAVEAQICWTPVPDEDMLGGMLLLIHHQWSRMDGFTQMKLIAKSCSRLWLAGSRHRDLRDSRQLSCIQPLNEIANV